MITSYLIIVQPQLRLQDSLANLLDLVRRRVPVDPLQINLIFRPALPEYEVDQNGKCDDLFFESVEASSENMHSGTLIRYQFGANSRRQNGK